MKRLIQMQNFSQTQKLKKESQPIAENHEHDGNDLMEVIPETQTQVIPETQGIRNTQTVPVHTQYQKPEIVVDD